MENVHGIFFSIVLQWYKLAKMFFNMCEKVFQFKSLKFSKTKSSMYKFLATLKQQIITQPEKRISLTKKLSKRHESVYNYKNFHLEKYQCFIHKKHKNK